MVRELEAERLAWRCPESWVPWSSLEEVEPAASIVGQDRAVEAIGFGLAMRGVGFNVFVTGLSGTGRLTTIKRFLDRSTDSHEAPDDVCFVFNFRQPDEPRALFLRAGVGRRFRSAMEKAVRELQEQIPHLLQDKEFRRRVERAVGDLQQHERAMVEKFESEVREAGFALVQIQAGPVTRPEILPVVGEGPVPLDQLPSLVEQGSIQQADAERFRESHEKLSDRLHDVFLRVAELRRKMQERAEKVRNDAVQPLVEIAVGRVRQELAEPRVEGYLSALRDDLLENLEVFLDGDGDGDSTVRWRVNLAVDSGETAGVPVVIETEPNYARLFGTIERVVTPQGESVTNFTHIRAGSLLRANGGYLVLNAEDVLLESKVWPGLKRALKYGRVQIQTIESAVFGGGALKPEPIPLQVKVVLIGDRHMYDLLYRYDHDFPKIFKVLADFDAIMRASESSAADVLSVLRKVTDEEGLLVLDRSGMAAMLEEAVRAARWRRRFSSRFSDLADVLREASYRASRRGAERIASEHVAEAREASRRRHGLSEDRAHEVVREGVVRVETDGSAVGQVNGLAVWDLGHHRFGRPSRISARVGLGREGVINVERQAGLSGPSHDKGVAILTGLLRGLFARSSPMTMACSITFEQSYGGVDGDSASSTEVYAILSALSGLPIRQDVAVTGSVDQYGTIQAIGGVNEKIEGFFRVCADRGLTGSQGVLIPATNVADLHLAEEVVAAVAEGRFHVWAAETVEQGVELLTGVPAGEWGDQEGWTEGSVFGRCQERLDEMARLMRRSAKGSGERENSEQEPPPPQDPPPRDPPADEG